MTGLVAEVEASGLAGALNPLLATTLNAYGNYTFNPGVFPNYQDVVGGFYSWFRLMDHIGYRGEVAEMENSFFGDFYNRVQVSPINIALGTVASTQSRDVTVWNAFTNRTANLQEIDVSDSTGVTIAGPSTPFVMNPLQETTYHISVGTAGTPTIDLLIQFNFSDVPDPLPVHVTGTRAVRFDNVPEVPITEDWVWLTDMSTAVDGTEQRIALRNTPRVDEAYTLAFDTISGMQQAYGQLLAAQGRLWVPQYQYATPITADAAVGATALLYNNALTDVRDGEYVLLSTPTTTALVQLSTLNALGAGLGSPLTFAVPKGSLIVPGSPSLLDDGTKLTRQSVDGYIEVAMSFTRQSQRTTLQRQGVTTALTQFLGSFVLDRRPILGGDPPVENYRTGQTTIDNTTGLPDIITRWLYSRISADRTFKVPRIFKPSEMDYWKSVFETATGMQKQFWVPTYRNDLTLAQAPADAAAAYSIAGTTYGDDVFAVPSHKYLEIETAAGIQRVTVTGATSGSGVTNIAFTPSIPTGALWQQVTRISYLLPMRLDDDKVTWNHTALESTLQISLRVCDRV